MCGPSTEKQKAQLFQNSLATMIPFSNSTKQIRFVVYLPVLKYFMLNTKKKTLGLEGMLTTIQFNSFIINIGNRVAEVM